MYERLKAATRINDTIGSFESIELSTCASIFAISQLQCRDDYPKDCDAHPTCDCYSQCHAIIW